MVPPALLVFLTGLAVLGVGAAAGRLDPALAGGSPLHGIVEVKVGGVLLYYAGVVAGALFVVLGYKGVSIADYVTVTGFVFGTTVTFYTLYRMEPDAADRRDGVRESSLPVRALRAGGAATSVLAGALLGSHLLPTGAGVGVGAGAVAGLLAAGAAFAALSGVQWWFYLWSVPSLLVAELAGLVAGGVLDVAVVGAGAAATTTAAFVLEFGRPTPSVRPPDESAPSSHRTRRVR